MLLALWGLFPQTRPGFDIYQDGPVGGGTMTKKAEPVDAELENWKARHLARLHADDEIILAVILSAVTKGIL